MKKMPFRFVLDREEERVNIRKQGNGNVYEFK